MFGLACCVTCSGLPAPAKTPPSGLTAVAEALVSHVATPPSS